jgi:hypothetical protein
MSRIRIIAITAAALGLITQASQAQPPAEYVAHEWGTFTSLQDSEGHTAEGMYHEEEPLPSFVHARGGIESPTLIPVMQVASLGNGVTLRPLPGQIPHPHSTKAHDFTIIAGTPLSITQKMETPVIYFYSQKPRHVKVDVDFPGGIITQYYPDVTRFSPPIGDVSAVANGHVSWDVDVSTSNLAVPEVDANSSWAQSRKVHANAITVGSENEKLLFYRGLGQFTTPLQIKSTQSGGLIVQNASDQTVPNAFLLKVTQQGAFVVQLGKIPAHGSSSVSERTLNQTALRETSVYLSDATSQVEQALERSGLYKDESIAMVNTWKRSYFTMPGLRVLYVLPREWTDSLLPLTMSPQPKQLVRTLVGRVEIMTRAEEHSLLSGLRSSFETRAQNHGSAETLIEGLGRFAEAKLRRVLQIAEGNRENTAFISYLRQLVEGISQS